MKRILSGAAIAVALSATAAYAQMPMHPMHEHHPEIMRSIHALENAKHDLEHADHDFGGHRMKAIEHIDGALHELHEAMEFDRH